MQSSQQLHVGRLRARLAVLRARYDDGAVGPAVYKVSRDLEIELAWAEHQQVLL